MRLLLKTVEQSAGSDKWRLTAGSCQGRRQSPAQLLWWQGDYGHVQAMLPEDQPKRHNTAEEGYGGEEIDFFKIQKITKQ